MVFKVIALRKIWPYFNTIIRLQHIVYIPTADFGQNLRETQAKTGQLKSFAQRYFLIS